MLVQVAIPRATAPANLRTEIRGLVDRINRTFTPSETHTYTSVSSFIASPKSGPAVGHLCNFFWLMDDNL